MKVLFLSWRDPRSRRWYPIGRLNVNNGNYEFTYTQGMLRAQREGGLAELPSFPEIDSVYRSHSLFPLFSNRVLARSRPEYYHLVQWASDAEHEDDPIALLAYSGGRRETDTFEVFPLPEPDSAGVFHIRFFLHGLSHFPESATERAEKLRPGEKLLCVHDFQNPRHNSALLLRTAETWPGDLQLLGFCPWYLADDLARLPKRMADSPQVRVIRVNPSPAPVQFRVLVGLAARWPVGDRPFSGPDYQPIPQSLFGALSSQLR